jgi:hypothetical protein
VAYFNYYCVLRVKENKAVTLYISAVANAVCNLLKMGKHSPKRNITTGRSKVLTLLTLFDVSNISADTGQNHL